VKNNWNSVAARISFFVALSSIVWLSYATSTIVTNEVHYKTRPVVDTTVTPVWPNEDNPNPSEGGNGIEVPLPDNITYSIEYNPETGEYEVVQKVGDKIDFRNRTTMTMDEYLDFNLSKNVTEYWIQQQQAQSAQSKDFAPKPSPLPLRLDQAPPTSYPRPHSLLSTESRCYFCLAMFMQLVVRVRYFSSSKTCCNRMFP
jgi:hypothetical protein